MDKGSMSFGLRYQFKTLGYQMAEHICKLICGRLPLQISLTASPHDLTVAPGLTLSKVRVHDGDAVEVFPLFGIQVLFKDNGFQIAKLAAPVPPALDFLLSF